MRRTRSRVLRILLAAAVGALLVGLGARALLPFAIERVAESWGSDRWGAVVAIDDVDLALVAGAVTLHGVDLRGAGEPASRLQIRRVSARISWRDLLERRVRVRDLEIDSPRLVLVRLSDGRLDLRVPSGRAAAERPDGWSFALDRAGLESGTLRFRDLALEEPGRWSASLDELVVRRVAFDPGPYEEAAQLRLDGEVEGAPLRISLDVGPAAANGLWDRFEGELEVERLPLAKLRLYLRDRGASALRGRLDARLSFVRTPGETRDGTPSGANDGGGDGIELRGSIALRDVGLSVADEACRAAWERLEIEGASARLPLDPSDSAGPRLGASRVSADGLDLRLLRDERGIACSDREEEAEEAPAPSRAGAPYRISVDELELDAGRLTIDDRAVEPFVETTLSGISASARSVKWPGLEAESFTLRARGPGEELRVEGASDGSGLQLSSSATQVELAPLNPYAVRYADLAVDRGAASADLALEARDGSLEARVHLVLHDLALARPPKGFESRYGLSWALALALLRDLDGNIALDLPISRDGDATEIDVAATVRGAVRRALANSLAAPLKLIGRVVEGPRSIERFEPLPIEFEPGQATLAAPGEDRVRRLAEVLARRPYLGVRLAPRIAPSDLSAPRSNGGDESVAANLARERADLVRARLVDRHGVTADRISEAVDAAELETAQGPPRVEIALEALRPT